jgi:hypothetical protein
VTKDAGVSTALLAADCWFMMPAANDVVPQAIALQPAVIARSLLPDDGANPGRALRCRMMSLLC